MGTKITLQILLQLVLIALNAVFACAEIAVIQTGKNKLEKLSDEGSKKARRLLKLTENPAKFLATIQVAITLAGFLGSAFAADNFSVYIVDALRGKTPLSDEVVETLAVIVITLLLSFLTLVFGELVPKRLAMKRAEKIALGISGTVRFISVIFAPIVWLLTASTNGLLRLMRIDPNESEDEVSEEDILMMADAGSEQGSINEEENKMIQNIFEFDDITVGEAATHRTEMAVLYLEDSDSDWEKTILESEESYFPVCGESIDDIKGILHSNTYLRLSDRSRASVMKVAVKPPLFVAQVTKTDVLFKKMKHERTRVAVVVDEYGGTYGLITMSHLVEQIVGDLDEEQEETVRESGEGYMISGLADRESIDELFGIDTGDDDSATVGGFVMEQFEKIPAVGDEITVDGIYVKVTKADNKRVLEVYAQKTEAPKEEE